MWKRWKFLCLRNDQQLKLKESIKDVENLDSWRTEEEERAHSSDKGKNLKKNSASEFQSAEDRWVQKEKERMILI